MTIPLRLTHQIALAVLLPLLIELGLLSALLMTLWDIDRDRKAESVSIKALQCINRVLNGVAQCGNFMLFNDKASPDKILSIEIVWEHMKEDEKELKRFIEEEKLRSHRIVAMTSAVDRLITEADNYGDIDFGVELKGRPGQLTDLLTPVSADVAQSGALAIAEQLQKRQRITATLNAHEARLEQLVKGGTVATLAVAGLSAFFLLARFWFGLRILMANTTNIALGKRLLPPLRGNDELARLDRLIHSLSADLNQAREKERALLDNTSAIICSCDETLRIVEANHVVEKLLGYDVQEIVGVILSSLFVAEDRDKAVEKIEHCRVAPGAVTFETRLRRKDRRTIVTEFTVEWSQVDQHYFLTIQDISERKEFEKQKAEVMEIISNDLRTPLAFILENLQILSSGTVGTFTDRGKRLAHNSTLSVTALMSLVGDLVDIERFESDSLTLNYESTDAEQLILRSIDMVRAAAEKKRLKVETETHSITIKADGERIIRVLVNLLGNAIKFSPEQSTIVCACSTEDTAGNTMVKFEVRDQGPGIPKEKQSVVFEKFKQAGLDTREEKAGSGLGLAICRAIVEAHGGTISVESVSENDGVEAADVQTGSTFWFRIPMAPSQ